jgi:hypothetical protein
MKGIGKMTKQESNLQKLKGKHPVLARLLKYEEGGANLLIPSVVMETGVDGVLQPVIEIVQLSSLCNKKKKDDGDVYEQYPGLAISGQGLFKLSSAACVEWDYQASERTANERDYTAYKAVGGIRKADGKRYPMYAERDIDMITTEQDIRERNEKATKYKKSEADIQKEIAQIRKFKLATTTTKAQNAVIRKLLGVKSVYSKAEIDKPFVVLRFSFQPDMSNKEVTKMLIDRFIASTGQIYGGETRPQLPATTPEKDEPIDVTPKNKLTPIERIDESEDEKKTFSEMNLDDQIAVLNHLIDQKGYNPSNLKKPFDDWEDQYLFDFFKHLNSSKDKKDDEIPF